MVFLFLGDEDQPCRWNWCELTGLHSANPLVVNVGGISTNFGDMRYKKLELGLSTGPALFF